MSYEEASQQTRKNKRQSYVTDKWATDVDGPGQLW